ncbi:hypothetical protein [Mycobacterium sp. GA-2829]|uniref:Rv1733c family protein n=1 Tax=Mycobacterium sp. GA-2829 TaxID=1772283 RepID=UPI000B184AA6|nr:hypothetical protein [Mycobacterium sp. GA-2829]
MVAASDPGDRSAAAMERFELRMPRWPLLVRLFGRDPLVRTTDRVEAVVVAVAVLVAVFALPVAAAIGTAVHDSRSTLYAEQNETRRSVTAMVSDAPENASFTRTGVIAVPVEWWDGNTRHTGTVQTQPTAVTGDSVELWIDAEGKQVTPPTPTSRAGIEGATAAAGLWLGVAAGLAIFTVTVQLVCDRIRSAAWQHDLDTLVDGGGHTTSHP